MEMELFQQKKTEYLKDVEMLQDIAMEFHAQREMEQLTRLEESMERKHVKLDPSDYGANGQEEALFEDKSKLNKVAGSLLLNYLETHLITAVMNGEDMEEKLKLLNPKLIHAKKRLEDQVFSEKQKIERMVVKCVMNFEADYHIMIRQIKEEISHYDGLMEELTINSEVKQILKHQEGWCMNKIKRDIQNLEKEIAAFEKEADRTENKCRQDTIHIMNNELFTMIAKKTESALAMIHYESTPDEIYVTEEQFEELSEKLFSHVDPKFDIAKDLENWTKDLGEKRTADYDTSEILKKIQSAVRKEFMKNEGRAKKNYNDFLKKYVDHTMTRIQEEATDYLESLQTRLYEDLDIRKEQKSVDRTTLEHLVEARNKIVRTLEVKMDTRKVQE